VIHKELELNEEKKNSFVLNKKICPPLFAHQGKLPAHSQCVYILYIHGIIHLGETRSDKKKEKMIICMNSIGDKFTRYFISIRKFFPESV
jgi:hypothetical protein